MEISFDLPLVLIATLAMIHLVQAQRQQGFISLDCGLPGNEVSPYKDSLVTRLEYRSDAPFIQSGKTGNIQKTMEADYLKPEMTLRYFPDGIRNCYNLTVEKGRKHLIRASFVYGNYDRLNNPPKFDLYLGPNPWATIDLKGLNIKREEILHTPTMNSLQICLVKTGETTPMISTLEVRPMGNGCYITESGSLKLYRRRYVSEPKTNNVIRYPKDAYDRLWSPYLRPEWTQISTTSDVVNSNGYDPPKAALKTAAIPTAASERLKISWTNSNHPDDQYYVYAHFAEIQELQRNETREFNTAWNGELYDENYIPPKFEILTVSVKMPSKACDGGKCSFQLIRTDESTLPPLLNAWEVFTVIHFPQSDTHENDVVAITSIKDAYELNRNWQGDPCVPHNLTWDGLNCSNTDISTPPRITSLNLSSSRLTGTIVPAIQNLTQLEKLDLSNNNLTGELPEFLGNIKSLLFINLSGNNFNGSISQALRKKGLELHVQGNPMLGDPRSPTKKNLVPILASVASVAIVFAVLVISLLLRNKKSTTGCTE